MDGVEASLRRLQTDHIDLYQIHANDSVTPVENARRSGAREVAGGTPSVVRSHGLMLIGGSFNLAAGLAIVLGHNVWSGGALTVVVTLIGWLVALAASSGCLRRKKNSSNFTVATAITGALGLYLSIAGFVG
jgi:aldo/keto reductase family protein